MQRFFSFILFIWLFISAWDTNAASTQWVSSWTASPQPVWGKDFPFPTNIPAYLQQQSFQQQLRLSIGGQRIRLLLSNEYGQQPLYIGAVAVSRSNDTAKNLPVTFDGQTSVTIPAGAPMLSDPVDLPVTALSSLTISMYFPQKTTLTTFHWDGRQTAWIAQGDQARQVLSGNNSKDAETTTARIFLSAVLVEATQPASSVVVLGDSITDGNTATLDANSRWPDFLAQRLATQHVAVLNAGISGARLLSDRMGVNALARFERDVLGQPNVQAVIILLGINDISWPGMAFDPQGKTPALSALTQGYQQLINRAHSKGIRVVGATLLPFQGALNHTAFAAYYNADKDRLRQQLNDWIRNGRQFDAVVDIDQLLANPQQPLQLNPLYDSGDHLHPSDAGSKAMADAIDLNMLLPPPPTGLAPLQ